jgi:FixJ family two-component response regulator
VTPKPFISIVDDDCAVRKSLAMLIGAYNFDVVDFPSADAFLQSERLGTTDCLITDLHMPDMDGLALQDHLVRLGYRIPTIFISGLPDRRSRTKAFQAGAIAFLSKPFDYEDLLVCIQSALSKTAAS